MSKEKIMTMTVDSAFSTLSGFVRSLPQTFSQGGNTLYKGRNTVKSFCVDGRTLVVKHYKRPNPVQRVAYSFFKKSKAARAYLFAAMLRERGFNTPREVAYLELGNGILMSDCYFVSESCMLPPLTGLLRRDDFDHDAADALAHLLARLHEKGVMHGDLNLTNILYERTADGGFSFWLIDTNRSKFIQPTEDDCAENLKRLTHDKRLMDYVIRRYAEIRGLDADKTVALVIKKLEDFEHKRAVTGKFKKAFRKIAGKQRKR